MSWLKKIFSSSISESSREKDKKEIPEGLWTKCEACQAILYRAELERTLRVCPKCDHHMHLTARERLNALFDADTMAIFADELVAVDVLKFRDTKRYKERLASAQKQTGLKDAAFVAEGKLFSLPIVVFVSEYRFIAGSMGMVVGEAFAQAIQHACAHHRPFVAFAASGGARMQEGLTSLMQMSKVSAALVKLAEKRLPFISVLTHPTMGGVSASYAMLGDIILAEPGALIGFTGPRVIEQTVREILPEGFQRSEFLLEHGAIDGIVHRSQMRTTLARLLSKLVQQPIEITTTPVAGAAAEDAVVERNG